MSMFTVQGMTSLNYTLIGSMLQLVAIVMRPMQLNAEENAMVLQQKNGFNFEKNCMQRLLRKLERRHRVWKAMGADTHKGK